MISLNAVAFLAVLIVINRLAAAEICAGCQVDGKYVKQKLQEVLSSQNSDDEIIKILSVSNEGNSGSKYTVKFETKNPTTKVVKFCKTSYVESPWISKSLNVLEFTCETERQQRQMLGELKDVSNSEMDLISQLADMAVKTLDDIDTDNSKRVVAEIIDAKKQLVNGIMYYLSLRVKTTSCDEHTNVISLKCLEKESMPQEICKIQIHRSFADSSPLNAKVVKSECEVNNYILDLPIESPSKSGIVKEAANFAAERINAVSNSIYKQILLRILDATSQTLSGTKIDLKLELGNTDCMKNMHKQVNCETVSKNSEKMICRVSVWSQPSKNKGEKPQMKVTSLNCGPFYRTKRSFVGGESNLQTNDPRVTNLKGFIEDELTARSNSQYTKTIVKVLNATRQIVSGTLTRVTVELADTNCLKGDNRAKSTCSATEQGHQICTLGVWEKPWLNQKEITQSACHSKPNVGINNFLDKDCRSRKKLSLVITKAGKFVKSLTFQNNPQ